MAPDAASQDLLYVSNCCDVTVYSYPQGRLEGRLKSFFIAAGECVDKAGDVFITDVGAGRVYEYAHGGTKRIKTFVDPIDPEGCAVDPTTGNLAVTTLGAGGSHASLAIFKGARGKPTYYKDPAFQEYFFCAYDDAGNLFIQGNSAPGSGHVVFAELSSGSSKLKTIMLNQYIGWPGGLQWDGKYLAVGDQNAPNVYEFAVSGSQGTKVGTVHMGSGANDVTDFFLDGQTLIAPNVCQVSGSKCHSDVLFFKYPAGGKATKKILKGIRGTDGAAVSKAGA